MNLKVLGLAGVAASLFAIPALAHHSFAMFDHDKTVTLNGTVKEFEWINPHSWVHLMAADPATGKVVEYSFEAGSTGQISARGWKMDSIKPGDKIAVEFHPLKDGSHGGQVLSVILANGTKLSQGRDTAE
jgi:hypothetical protein